jgi:uncharacterized protein with PQ loop repeat
MQSLAALPLPHKCTCPASITGSTLLFSFLDRRLVPQSISIVHFLTSSLLWTSVLALCCGAPACWHIYGVTVNHVYYCSVFSKCVQATATLVPQDPETHALDFRASKHKQCMP